MGQCHLCKRRLGLFTKSVKRDGLRLCMTCSDIYVQERRQRVIDELMSDSRTQPIFTIPCIRTRNPDIPKSQIVLLGAAVFLNKGICFLHLAQCEKANAGWGLMFGVIGAAAADSAAKARRKKEFAVTQMPDPRTPEELAEAMQGAQQVLFYPFQDLRKLRHNSQGFNVRVGGKKKAFGWDGGRRTRKQYRGLLDAYRNAIATQSDPVAMCSQAAAGGSTDFFRPAQPGL